MTSPLLGQSHLAEAASELAPDDVHVWRIDLTKQSGPSVLPIEEMQRAARFRTELLRQQFCNGRKAIRAILSSYLGEAPEDIRFVYGEHGKPELPSADLFVNWSHSENLLLLAVSRNLRVGIDVEQERMIPDFLEIGRDYLQVEDPVSLTRFLEIWTEKEARLKAMGCGWTGECDRRRESSLFFQRLAPAPGYVAGLCSDIQPRVLRCFDFAQ